MDEGREGESENVALVPPALPNLSGTLIPFSLRLGIMENHPLFLSVFSVVAGCAACAWGAFPELNALIHLEPFPDDAFRWKVMSLVGASLVGTFVWDRVCTAVFAPEIFRAMLDEVAFCPAVLARPRVALLCPLLTLLLAPP